MLVVVVLAGVGVVLAAGHDRPGYADQGPGDRDRGLLLVALGIAVLGWCPRWVLRCAVRRPRRSRPSGLSGDVPLGLGRSACCADGVRSCPRGSAAGSPRARTYSGQRRCGRHRLWVFAQVRGPVEMQAGACCKTVGSAYVGSNPTPATTCKTARWLRKRGLAGPFSSCHGVYQDVTVGRYVAVVTDI
jgi:hypothetical protein